MKTLVSIPLRQYVALLRHYLREQRAGIAGLSFLLLASIVLQLLSPQIVRFFIDTAKEQGSMRMLLNAAILFMAVTIVQQLLAVAAGYIGESVGWNATNALRRDVVAHCLSLDMSFHKRHTPGSIIERVDGDVNALANFFSNFAVALMGNLLLAVGIVFILFRENPVFGGAMLLFAFFAMYAIQRIRKAAVPYWGVMRQMSADFYGFLGEHLEGAEDIRANGAVGYVMRKFHIMQRFWLKVRIKANLGSAWMWITTIVVFAIGNAIALALCAYFWKQDAITLGTVYMLFYYTELMAKPIESIRAQLEDLQRADASIIRIRELLAIEPAVKDGQGVPLPDGPLSVQFQDVTFGYEANATTLHGINFEFGRGETLGLLGRTGSGKTTIARLLLRFYDPSSGSIRLNEVDVRDAKVRQLRERVGLVTQSIEILQGTVRDNLTMLRDDIPDDRIVGVLHELGLGGWLGTLPYGLDTPLESRGSGLSAGESQLLAFARVFLTDPGLVILDEATSRLDPATELKIEKAMTKLLANRTCLIIAHRLATVQRADQILIIEDGRIVEFGERSKLAASSESRYSRMVSIGTEELLA